MSPEPVFRTYGHGKLLLSGEYLILDGATGLCVPTRTGQNLEVFESDTPGMLLWESRSVDGSIWFEAVFDTDMNPVSSTDQDTARTLSRFLRVCATKNPDFIPETATKKVVTRLGFDREWGLGSSSTLIHCLSQWADIDPFAILGEAFKGSGYDIAQAGSDQPLLYRRKAGTPKWEPADFNPSYAEGLFFVYLNRKQNSRSAITSYSSIDLQKREHYRPYATSLTRRMLEAGSLEDFAALATMHETLLASLLETEPVKDRLFPDYPGAVKSLGAWGGDFVLATGGGAPAYFSRKGFDTVIPYGQMVLPPAP